MDKREWNYKLLEAMIHRTPSVIALDADLGWISYLSLCRMKNYHSMTESKDNQSWIYINEYKVSDEIIEIYDSKNHLISLIQKRLLTIFTLLPANHFPLVVKQFVLHQTILSLRKFKNL
jgi:phosphomevalonate kinase